MCDEAAINNETIQVYYTYNLSKRQRFHKGAPNKRTNERTHKPEDNDYIMADCYIKFYSHFNKHFVISIHIRIEFSVLRRNPSCSFRTKCSQFTIFEWQADREREGKKRRVLFK